MTLDIWKAFNLVNHLFLIIALETYGFEEDFIKLTQILIQNQESCVINGGTATIYFKLKRGTRQGDAIPAWWSYTCFRNSIFIYDAKRKILMTLIFLKKKSTLYTAWT